MIHTNTHKQQHKWRTIKENNTCSTELSKKEQQNKQKVQREKQNTLKQQNITEIKGKQQSIQDARKTKQRK